MRLKQSISMFLLLSLLLGSICFGIAINNSNEDENEIIDDVVVDVVPTSYCKTVNNSELVPVDVLNLIKNYMDDYFKSIYTLELQDTTKYFSNELNGSVSDAAIKLTVESRKLYDFDFTMSDAYYVLNIKNCDNVQGKYYIDFLEDDCFSFKFLNGVTSECYDIENSMIIEQVNGEYKISEYNKTQGYYMMFNDSKNDDSMDKIYDFYYKRLLATIQDENYKKELAMNNEYLPTKVFKIKYDRKSAGEYAENYYHIRNEKYYDYDDEGGNCQNFASQVLISGGMPMDYYGDYQWYFDSYSDYTSSWVLVPGFSEYCMENDEVGLACDTNINLYYAEPGDIVQVGISSITHTCVVSKIVDGHILLNSNSIDMKDFPMEGYTYPVRKLIKILGSNS